MTATEPRIGTIDFDGYSDNFWRYADVVSAVYQPGMTAAETTEAIKVWISRKLVPYLRANFQSLEISWETQVTDLVSKTTTALADAIGAMAEADFVAYALSLTNSKSPIDGKFHVDNFGAIGDGITHDAAAIQSAIDAANAEYVRTGTVQIVQFSPKVYLCENTVTENPAAGIMLKNGVELVGPGTLKVAPGSYWIGTLYALIRSRFDSVLTNAGIRNLSIDGNKSAFNIPGGNNQASNIVLGPSQGVWVDNVRSFSAAGEGIQVAGNMTSPGRDIRIENCSVSSAGRIGIQVSQFDGLVIRNNDVSWTTDNAIDVYGERDDHTTGVNGVNFLIDNNRIHDCGNGIFLETVADGTTSNNAIRNCNEGVHVNRINGEPHGILISGNAIFGGNNAIGLTGDTGGVTIRNNMLASFNQAGVSLGGAGRVSQYYILDNTMNGNSNSVPLVLIRTGTDQAADIVHLRTLTKNQNGAFDNVNYCTNNAGNVLGAAERPGS